MLALGSDLSSPAPEGYASGRLASRSTGRSSALPSPSSGSGFYLGCIVQVSYGYSEATASRWLRLFEFNRAMLASAVLFGMDSCCRFHSS